MHRIVPQTQLYNTSYVLTGQNKTDRLCEVNERVETIVVPLHVLVFDEPLNLFFDHLLGRNEHVLEDLNELRLEGCVGHPFTHLHDLYDSFLEGWEGSGREGEREGRKERGLMNGGGE